MARVARSARSGEDRLKAEAWAASAALITSAALMSTSAGSPPPLCPEFALVEVEGGGGLNELRAKPRTLRSPPAKNRCEAGNCENRSTQLAPSSPRVRTYQGPPIGQTRSARL